MAEQDDGKDDKDLVPLKAVEEQREAREAAEQARDAARLEAARLQGEIEGRTAAAAAQPAKDAPKEYTPAELQAAVDDQTLTPAAAQAIRDGQSERRTDARIDARVDAKAEALVVAQTTSEELGRYKQAIPDLNDQASAAFAKVKGEFEFLVKSGSDPRDPRTELIASRIAFGDVDKLEKIGQETRRETHQETGGAREPGADGAAARADAWPKDMPAKHRRYYEGLINKGILADRKAAIDRFNYKPKHNPRYAA